MVSLGVEASVVALKRRCLEVLNAKRREASRTPLERLPELRIKVKERRFELLDDELAADIVGQEVLECDWPAPMTVLPEECLRLLVSFGAATDVLALRKVSPTFRELTRDEMVGTVFLYTDDNFMLCDAATGAVEEIRLLSHDQEVEHWWDWSLTADGCSLATVGFGSVIRVWRVPSGEHVTMLPGEHLAVAWSPDGKRLAGSNGDRTVTLYDAATREIAASFEGPLGHESISLGFSPNGKVLASGGNEVVVFWDVETGAQLWSLDELLFGDIGQKVQFSPDSTRLYSIRGDSVVRVSSCETGHTLFDIENPDNVDVLSLAISRDGAYLATLHSSISVWDARTGSLRRTIAQPWGPGGWVSFSPDSRRLAVYSYHDGVYFVDTITGSVIGLLKPPRSRGWRHREGIGDGFGMGDIAVFLSSEEQAGAAAGLGS